VAVLEVRPVFVQAFHPDRSVPLPPLRQLARNDAACVDTMGYR
jgi:hypothetical protein